MKRIIKIFCMIMILYPLTTHAITLKEYEDQVAKYTAELQNKQNQIATSEEEISQIKAKINSIKKQINDVGIEITQLENEITKSNVEIDQKQQQIKKIVNYYQISSSGNYYIEYIFGAESITDMIYRFAVSEQLASYNDKTIKELNDLIEANQKKKNELNTKQTELGKLNVDLYDEQDKIESSISEIEGTLPSTTSQIAFYQKKVDYYKARGCKSNDVIGVTCDVSSSIAIIGPNGFRFPVNGGRITQNYGNNGHKGADIGKACGTPIYAVAPGKVYYVGSDLDKYGANMVLIVHNVNGKLVFSQYAHLSGYNVSVNEIVDTDTVIGYMGNTGYSFGCHLHLEMSENVGWGYVGGTSNGFYSKYVKNIISPFKYVPRP